MHPDSTSLETFNLETLKWLDLKDMEMQLIEFQSNSIWKQKFIDLRSDLELIENDRALGVITCNTEEKVLKSWNAIPDSFIRLKRLAIAILSIFSSTYCCESLFSQITIHNNMLMKKLIKSQLLPSITIAKKFAYADKFIFCNCNFINVGCTAQLTTTYLLCFCAFCLIVELC